MARLSTRKPKKLRLLDLFCGAGGMSLGFDMSESFETVGAIDNWQPAVDTFLFNRPHLTETSVICDDIARIFSGKEIEDARTEEFRSLNVDVIVGGPPCQGMSLAGKRIGNDPRNSLFRSFVKAVDTLRPKIFLMENVPGLLSMNSGALNSAILRAFLDIGYNHFDEHAPKILYAECYGVPQIRRRLFYVGFREDIDPFLNGWPPPPTHKKFNRSRIHGGHQDDLFDGHDEATNLPEPLTVAYAISDLPPLKSGEGADEMALHSEARNPYQKLMRSISVHGKQREQSVVFNHEAPNHTEKLLNLIRKSEPGQSVDPKYTDSRKWHPNEPGYTVKALGAGGGSTNRRAFHYDKSQARGSTVRENARIQSFPDWYRFLGAKTHQMTQVGNAVPPLMALEIAKIIRTKFEPGK